ETPVQQRDGGENTGSYGGGFEPPITHQLAFLGFGKDTPTQITAQISQHQPRAVAWDSDHDALYIAGLGTDSILQVKNASQVGVAEGLTASLTDQNKERCGPDGVAITRSGDVLVWCAFSRTVKQIDFVNAKGGLASTAKVRGGHPLVATRMNDKQHK